MRLLLDTHTLYWASFDPDRLSQPAKERLLDNRAVVYVSFASLWEMAIKQGLGKLTIPDDYFKELPRHGYQLLPISLAHIEAYKILPLLHRDPFDRMLVAQAISEDLTVLTRDSEIQKYSVKTEQA